MKGGDEPESFPRAALPCCSEQLELLKLRLLQEANTQTLFFEGCGNMKEKLRKKSKNLFGEPAGAELPVPAHCPCPMWDLASSGSFGG